MVVWSGSGVACRKAGGIVSWRQLGGRGGWVARIAARANIGDSLEMLFEGHIRGGKLKKG
jgi:hypothetical protein